MPAPISDIQHNMRMESGYAAFNGVFFGITFVGVHPLARTGVGVTPFELTILMSAFPVGASLGPFWAWLAGPRGMQKMVVRCGILSGLLLLPIEAITNSLLFTLLVATAQMLISPIRLGQSTLYGILYPLDQRGRIIGRFVSMSFLTMIPSLLLAGYLIKLNPQNYRIIFPAAGICAILACIFYSQIRVPSPQERLARPRMSIRGGLRKVREVFTDNKGFRYFQIAFFLSGSAFFMSHHIALMLIEDRFALEPDQLTLIFVVVPLLLLTVGSPLWGRILDRFGIGHCRLIIAILLTLYLSCYLLGLWSGALVWLVFAGILKGVTNGGGHVTWYLGSSHFAPHPDEVPTYHGIHLLLNGARGLLMPWIGLQLYFVIGQWAILVAMLISLLAAPVSLRLMNLGRRDAQPID